MAPSVQLINKTDYTLQSIVPLSEHANPPLPPDSVRIRTRLISLTTNNFTYAKLGGFGFPGLAWWDAWPMPANLPPPHDKGADVYCRISAWGYSEVVESNIEELPVGVQLWGYQPIGTAAEVLELKSVGLAGHWVEISQRRKDLLSIYNRYVRTGAPAGAEEKTSRGWDSLMKALFESAYSLNRFAFGAGGGAVIINPLGFGLWSAEDASLEGAVVVLLAASGKAGLSFAHQLRQREPEEIPNKIVAVGSAKSRGFSSSTGLFDDLVEYDALGQPDFDLASVLGGYPKKVVLVNFGARGSAADRWAEALRPRCARLQVVLVGADATDPQGGRGGELASLTTDPQSGVAQMNAGGLRESAIAKLGEDGFFKELDAAWDKFKADGAVRGLKLVWRQGIESLGEEWDALAGGKYGPDVGLLFEL